MSSSTSYVLSMLIIAILGFGKNQTLKAVPEFNFQREIDLADKVLLTYNKDQVHKNAHIFLVAGSKDGANFAQEVIDQKQHWISIGYDPSEIACYYVVPDDHSYLADKIQYDSLASELQDCHKASMKNISEDLLYVDKEEPLYFYATSHGNLPFSLHGLKMKNKDDREKLFDFLDQYPKLDSFFISLDATPDELVDTADFSSVVHAYGIGKYALKELLFSPQNFKKVLRQWPEHTSKVVVLQGCYSGGFIKSNHKYFDRQTLRDIPNITLLSASRHDRTSFGCDLASRSTYYGEAFLSAIQSADTYFDLIDWEAVHDDVDAVVSALESKMKYKPSLPQFFQNQVSIQY